MSKELTRQVFEARLEELRRLKTSDQQKDQDKFLELKEKLSEKGVECTIITPLIEMVLEFDPVLDVRYEEPSEIKHGQRFDFLLDDRFLIEVKRLGANLVDAYDQIGKYLGTNPKLEYGILANGIDYEVFLRKDFIEQHMNGKLKHIDKPVVKVLDLSLEDHKTQDLLTGLSVFKKDQYQERFKKLATIVARIVDGGSGALGYLHDDKEMDNLLKERIKSLVQVKRGIYWEDVDSGKRKEGDKLCFKNQCIEITVEITKRGTVILKENGANVTNFLLAKEQGWGAIITLLEQYWSKQETEFEDPLDIVRQARGMQKLQKQHLYPFVSVS